MTKSILITMLLFFSAIFSIVYADKDGNWRDGNNKTGSCPITVSSVGNTMYIHFEKEYSNLEIEVENDRNEIVYHDIISCNAGEDFIIPAMLVSGERYQFFIAHPIYGYLFGTFETK